MNSLYNEDDYYAGYFALTLVAIYDISPDLALFITDNESRKDIENKANSLMKKAFSHFKDFFKTLEYKDIVIEGKTLREVAHYRGVTNMSVWKSVNYAKTLVSDIKTLYLFDLVPQEDIRLLFSMIGEKVPSEEEKNDKRRMVCDLIGYEA